MARLTWNNVSAPDFSGTSQILRNAGASFQDGLTRANEILSQYDLGQKEKNDQALLSEVAALNSEEELANFLNSDRLTGLNISSTMRDSILGLRQNILDAGQTRANTALTGAQIDQTRANIGLINANRTNVLGRLDLARTADGRVQSDWERANREREALYGLTGLTIDAVNDGRANGFGNANDLSRYAVGGAAARSDSFTGLNPNFSVRISDMLSAAEADGINLRITSAYRSPAVQASIVANNMAKYGLGSEVDNWLSDVKSMGPEAAGQKWRSRMREAGLTKFVAMPGGSQHQKGNAIDFANASGGLLRDANSVEARWLKANAGRFGLDVPMDHEPWQVELGGARSGTSVPYQSTGNSPSDLLTNALRNSTNLPPDVALGLLNRAYKAQSEGQGIIDARNAELDRAVSEERQLTAIFDAINDPTSLSTDDVVSSLMNNEVFQTRSEALSAIQRSGGLLAEDQPLAGVLSPDVQPDAVINSTVDTALRAADREIDALPQTRMLERAGRFAENPTAGLINELGLGQGADGEDPRTYVFGLFGERADENTLTRHINSIADRTGVTPEIAASAMAEVFHRDPFGVNRTDRRFDEEEVISVIEEHLGPEALGRLDNLRISRDRKGADLEAARLQYDTLRTQAAKYREQNREVPAALSSEIDLLKTTISNGSTPELARNQLQRYIRQNGMAERLRSLDPNSADYYRAIRVLEAYIKIDPDLSADEKRLLLATIQG